MAESKDTITVRVNIEMTTASLEMIVEKAKKRRVVTQRGFIASTPQTR